MCKTLYWFATAKPTARSQKRHSLPTATCRPNSWPSDLPRCPSSGSSSPFVRAIQSIAPLAERLGLPIATDKRLAERVLAAGDLPDWLAALKSSFDDLHRCLAGGESSRAAMQRASEVASEAMAHPASATLPVTHGNLMALLLKNFDDRIGFANGNN